jgi:hypothetical protein
MGSKINYFWLYHFFLWRVVWEEQDEAHCRNDIVLMNDPIVVKFPLSSRHNCSSDGGVLSEYIGLYSENMQIAEKLTIFPRFLSNTNIFCVYQAFLCRTLWEKQVRTDGRSHCCHDPIVTIARLSWSQWISYGGSNWKKAGLDSTPCSFSSA